jgi:hypothetical protein
MKEYAYTEEQVEGSYIYLLALNSEIQITAIYNTFRLGTIYKIIPS